MLTFPFSGSILQASGGIIDPPDRLKPPGFRCHTPEIKMLAGGIIMHTLLGFGILLIVLFAAGIAVELRRGLKEDKKFSK